MGVPFFAAAYRLLDRLNWLLDDPSSGMRKLLETRNSITTDEFIANAEEQEIPLMWFMSPKGMSLHELSKFNDALVFVFESAPVFGTPVTVLELASGQKLSFTIEDQRELSTGEKVFFVATTVGQPLLVLGVSKFGGKTMSRIVGVVDDVDGTIKFIDDAAGTMFRRTRNVGDYASLKVPMQMRYVQRVADEAGVGLSGVNIRIVREPRMVGSGFLGSTPVDGKTIYLYPDSFMDLETLVKTLGHERTHVMQRQIFGRSTNADFLKAMEDAAYGIEDEFWQFYLQNKTGRLEIFR